MLLRNYDFLWVTEVLSQNNLFRNCDFNRVAAKEYQPITGRIVRYSIFLNRKC